MKTLQAIVAATLLMMTLSVYADYTIDKGAIRMKKAQDIVIVLSQHPADNVESTCLALTLGQFLRGAGKKVNVTLFLRNDGVFLADDQVLGDDGDYDNPPQYVCHTPWGPRSLRKNLVAFLNENPDNMVNCPLCWFARYCEESDPILGCTAWKEPDYGYPKDPEDFQDQTVIPKLLLGADKVIDFGETKHIEEDLDEDDDDD